MPGKVLKLPQHPFEVGQWIYVVGVLCAPIAVTEAQLSGESKRQLKTMIGALFDAVSSLASIRALAARAAMENDASSTPVWARCS